MIGSPLDRMHRHSDPAGALLSVFVTVPPDPTALRESPARLDGVMAPGVEVRLRGPDRLRAGRMSWALR